MDITTLFKACVKTTRLKNKTLPSEKVLSKIHKISAFTEKSEFIHPEISFMINTCNSF